MTVKKTWLVDPVLPGRARKILGARTEEEAVTCALREIPMREEIDKAFGRHRRVLAGVKDMFPDATAPRRR